MTVSQFQEKLMRWCESRADIQAVLLIGSRARTDHPADQWSDVDLILFAEDIKVYTQHDDWLAAFGEVLLFVFEHYSSGDGEWLALLANGLKVDFYWTVGAADLTAVIQQASYFPVVQRGAKIWYTRPDVSLTLPASQPPPPHQPKDHEFQQLVHSLYLYGHKMAKLIRRGDLVRAKMVLECVMRPQLLTLAAWHAQAMYGPARDTWYNGRFLAEWVDPRVLAALPNTYGDYTGEETWRSLLAALILSRWLAEETAVRHQFAFPTTAVEKTLTWIRDMYLTNESEGV